MGSDKKIDKGPRKIDIDILFFNSEIIHTSNMTIPHISLQERDFVLKPFMDIDENFVHPKLNRSIKVFLFIRY